MTEERHRRKSEMIALKQKDDKVMTSEVTNRTKECLRCGTEFTYERSTKNTAQRPAEGLSTSKPSANARKKTSDAALEMLCVDAGRTSRIAGRTSPAKWAMLWSMSTRAMVP